MWSYPLQWPFGWGRSEHRRLAQFSTELRRAQQGLGEELRKLGAADVIVTSNMRLGVRGEPLATQPVLSDPGVAVYFMLRGEEKCFPCDRWIHVEDNVHAIGKTVAALRGIERWGASDMVEAAFRGFAALPAGGGTAADRPWWDELGVLPNASPDEIQRAYRWLVITAHADKVGDPARFLVLQNALERALAS